MCVSVHGVSVHGVSVHVVSVHGVRVHGVRVHGVSVHAWCEGGERTSVYHQLINRSNMHERSGGNRFRNPPQI